MQDVQFNAMALAASDRALARRRAEALAEAGDFETTLGAVTPPAAAALEAPAAEAAIPVVTAPAAADLTGAQMDTLMANFGKADAVPPAAIAAAAPPAKPGDQTDTAAVAALKSAPAAANLTPEQMTALALRVRPAGRDGRPGAGPGKRLGAG